MIRGYGHVGRMIRGCVIRGPDWLTLRQALRAAHDRVLELRWMMRDSGTGWIDGWTDGWIERWIERWSGAAAVD